MTSEEARVSRRRDRVAGLAVHARYSTPASSLGSPPVVLVHGLVVSSASFVPALRRLGASHPSFAPDVPGFGLSDKPGHPPDLAQQADYLAAWLDRLAIGPATVVGCSLGSQLVSQLAVARPDLVARAVLVSPTMDPAARRRRVALARWLAELPHELGMLPLLLRDYLRAGIPAALRAFETALADAPEQRLPQLHMPTLVIRGELDPIVSQAWAERVTELLPDGRLAVVHGHAHALNFGAPADFARLVSGFAAAGGGARRVAA